MSEYRLRGSCHEDPHRLIHIDSHVSSSDTSLPIVVVRTIRASAMHHFAELLSNFDVKRFPVHLVKLKLVLASKLLLLLLIILIR